MAQMQAQIYVHGEPIAESLTIEDSRAVYAMLMEVGAWPIQALIEARQHADDIAIKALLGEVDIDDVNPVAVAAEFQSSVRIDPFDPPWEPTIFVDPQEFMQVGVAAAFHRHIVVRRIIDVDDMPPLNVLGES
jgi:hypothetical protein